MTGTPFVDRWFELDGGALFVRFHMLATAPGWGAGTLYDLPPAP